MPGSARRYAACLGLAIALALAAAAPARACGAETDCTLPMGSYRLAAPPGPPRGAVVFLHGYGGAPAGVMANGALRAALAARGYALVAPAALPAAPGRPAAWNSTGDPRRRDDAAFILSVAEDAGRRLGLARGRMLLAGFSGGGMMVWRLACRSGDAFPAYAPVAGVPWRPLPADCAGPVRLLHMHGWTDRVVPLEGRAVAGGALVQGDLFAALALMRRAAGCAGDAPDAAWLRGALMLRRWDSCRPGGEIMLVLHPGGHLVPPEWPALVLDWFEAGSGSCLRPATAASTC